MIQDLLALNWWIFEKLNQRAGHEPLIDPSMIFGANDAIFALPLLLLVLWFALSRWRRVVRRMGAPSASYLEATLDFGERFVLLAGVAVVLALALNVGLGHLVYEPRPFVSHPGLVHQLVLHVADASFPSDHEAVATAIATILVLVLVSLVFRQYRASRLLPDLRPAFNALASLTALVAFLGIACVVYIGIARVYVGVHYPGDILGGAVCGTAGGIAAAPLGRLAEPLVRPVLRLGERLHLA